MLVDVARRVLVDARAARDYCLVRASSLPWKRWWVRATDYVVANARADGVYPQRPKLYQATKPAGRALSFSGSLLCGF